MKSKLAGVGASKAVMGASLALLCAPQALAQMQFPTQTPGHLIPRATFLRQPRPVKSLHISSIARPGPVSYMTWACG